MESEQDFHSQYNLFALRHTAALFEDDDSTTLIAKDGRVYHLAPYLDEDGDLVLHELDFIEC